KDSSGILKDSKDFTFAAAHDLRIKPRNTRKARKSLTGKLWTGKLHTCLLQPGCPRRTRHDLPVFNLPVSNRLVLLPLHFAGIVIDSAASAKDSSGILKDFKDFTFARGHPVDSSSLKPTPIILPDFASVKSNVRQTGLAFAFF